MPAGRRPLRVVKSPLTNGGGVQAYSKNFPQLPTLYLEVIENQSKIKPAFIGKDFQMQYAVQPPQGAVAPTREPIRENKQTANLGNLKVFADDSSADSPSPSRANSPSPMFSGESPASAPLDSFVSDASSDDDLTTKLKALLREEETKGPKEAPSVGGGDKLFGHRSKKRTPPTLDQLRQSGAYKEPDVVRDIHENLTEEEEEDRKRELIFKFDLLRKSYKGAAVPEYSIHSDYKMMSKAYDQTLKRLSMDSSVENYKTYLIGCFMLVEFVLGNWLKFDMQGYTQQQILSMNSYEKLLLELGEKSYVPQGEQWPVEARLLFLVVVNAVFFIVSKMILRKTGSNIMGMMNSVMGKGINVPAPSSASAPPPPKRKMRGPNINLDEIPGFNSPTDD